MKRTFIAAALIGGLIAAPAFAGPIEDAFKKIDTGEDGSISRAEFIRHQIRTGRVSERQAATQFGKLAGPDGLISIDEFRAGPNRPTNVRPRTASRPSAPPPRAPSRSGGGAGS